MSVRVMVWAVPLLSITSISLCSAQPSDIGIAPAVLADEPYVFETAEQGRIRVTVIARGIRNPYSFAFLPDGDALIAERGTALHLVRDAAVPGAAPRRLPDPVPGLPQLDPPNRRAGLHDIALHPDFENNRYLYFTYNLQGDIDPSAPPTGRGPQRPTAIALMRGRFDGSALSDVEQVFATAWEGGGGSRIAFGHDGSLYMTTGAAFNRAAQDLNSQYGKVLRLRDDGSAPADNPFAGRSDARPEVYSYGHRDHLGLTIHPDTGAVLNAEHGPNGGDEVNLILPGRNYGWPDYSFGRDYDGPRISALPAVAGIELPLVVWLPSIAPTGLTVYTGDRLPAWRGNLFVGSARRGQIPGTGGLERVVLNDNLEEIRRETLLGPLHLRIRDVRQGPDGLLYVISDESDGALLRIEPAD